jgi:hypothetical protein
MPSILTNSDILKQIGEFLDRTPIVGTEAEMMVLCKNHVRRLAQPQPQPVPGPEGVNLPAAVPQVAGTSGK